MKEGMGLMTETNFITNMFYSEYDPWHPYHAVNEIEVYCDLLEHLQDRIDCLEARDRDEKVALLNVQAVINSYAIEIAMKSFWALDHPGESVLHTHDLLKIFDGLKGETKKSLEGLQLPRQVLERASTPFISNRYSMEHDICSTIQDGYAVEHDRRVIALYHPLLLRKLAQILRDTMEARAEDINKALFKTVTLSAE